MDSAREKLSEINPNTKVEITSMTINEKNISSMTDGFDAIVDAMDNFPARYILNRMAVQKNIPFFYGAVRGLEGRAMTIIPGNPSVFPAALATIFSTMVFPIFLLTPFLPEMVSINSTSPCIWYYKSYGFS